MSDEKQPAGFKKATQKAMEILKDNDKSDATLKKAEAKAQSYQEQLKNVWEQLTLLIDMARDYRNGKYPHLPWRAILWIFAAIVYFINPLDIIPDFIFAIGFLDDAAVIGFVINALHEEIEKYKTFVAEHHQTSSQNGVAQTA
jgi:uncharacterized membrane protein YkvA (DUF1232 family)